MRSSLDQPQKESDDIMDVIDNIGKSSNDHASNSKEIQIRKRYEETMGRSIDKKLRSMVIIVTEDTYDDALSAFDFAVAGATIGMEVHMYFTNRGVNVITRNYKPVRTRGSPVVLMERMLRRSGVATLAELMFQAKDLGVKMYGCYASLKSLGMRERNLISGVTILRTSEFLSITLGADIQISLG